MNKTTFLLLAAWLALPLGCASTQTPAPLRGADVTAPDQAPATKAYSAKVPGVGPAQLIGRTFIGQPPLIPHAIEKYIPLTREENACLECHITDELRGQKIPRMGESHFSKTVRTRDGQPVVEMSRFQCDSCHVPQIDARPLVDNSFVGVTQH